VLEQSFKSVEYIVIDGASTDGSTGVLETYNKQLSYWVSEPDEGIYDAMNKGIDQATGEYILFLNSGDSLYNKNVLNDFAKYKTQEDIVYGNANFVNLDGSSYLKIMPSKLDGLMIFERTLNHQCIFHNKRIFENGKRYDLKYQMLADWALYNEVILINQGTYKHLDLIISNYDTSGFSSDSKNKIIMQADRNQFYASHVDYFLPLILGQYKTLKKEHDRLKSRRLIKAALRLSKILKLFKK